MRNSEEYSGMVSMLRYRQGAKWVSDLKGLLGRVRGKIVGGAGEVQFKRN